MPPPSLALTVLEGKDQVRATPVISCGFWEEMGSVDGKERGGIVVRSLAHSSNLKPNSNVFPGKISFVL